jgi:hypothetical protein
MTSPPVARPVPRCKNFSNLVPSMMIEDDHFGDNASTLGPGRAGRGVQGVHLNPLRVFLRTSIESEGRIHAQG